VKALRRLVGETQIERKGAGKKGDAYRYSVSGFLVPPYIREPENQNQKTRVSPDGTGDDSGPRLMPTSGEGALSTSADGEPDFGEALEL
jgi:hypothetical protein